MSSKFIAYHSLGFLLCSVHAVLTTEAIVGLARGGTDASTIVMWEKAVDGTG